MFDLLQVCFSLTAGNSKHRDGHWKLLRDFSLFSPDNKLTQVLADSPAPIVSPINQTEGVLCYHSVKSGSCKILHHKSQSSEMPSTAVPGFPAPSVFFINGNWWRVMTCPSTRHLSVLCRERNDVFWADKCALFGLWWELCILFLSSGEIRVLWPHPGASQAVNTQATSVVITFMLPQHVLLLLRCLEISWDNSCTHLAGDLLLSWPFGVQGTAQLGPGLLGCLSYLWLMSGPFFCFQAKKTSHSLSKMWE